MREKFPTAPLSKIPISMRPACGMYSSMGCKCSVMANTPAQNQGKLSEGRDGRKDNETRKPNSEGRKESEFRRPKDRTVQGYPAFGFRPSAFELLSDFGLRISDFSPSPHLRH